MESIDFIGQLAEYGVLGIFVAVIGYIAFSNRRALQDHEGHCDRRYAEVENKIDVARKEGSESRERIYRRIEKVDDKREEDKEEILKAISDQKRQSGIASLSDAVSRLTENLKKDKGNGSK